jgi:hypothetical protein
MDVGIGAIGLIPLPWLGTVSLLAAIGIQGPLIYQPLVRKLQKLYGLAHVEDIAVLTDTASLAGATADLASEFGVEFLKDSLRELLQEQGAGLALGAFPVVGGIAAGTLDAFVAVKLTRIVGTMAIVYCENAGRWPASRKDTRDFLRALLLSKPNSSLHELVVQIVGSSRRREERDAAVVSAASLSDGIIQGVRIDYDAQGLNHAVLGALERWKNIDPRSLSGLEGGFTNSVSGQYADNNLISSLKGFVAEEVAADKTGGTLPDATNVPAWDIAYHGEQWQVKVGTTAVPHATDAYRDHPDFPIMTDPDSATTLTAHGVEAIGIGGLENDSLVHITEQTASSLEDLAQLGPDVPIVSGIVISFLELRRCVNGTCTLNQALTSITVKVGSRAAAISLASFVAVAIAASAGILATSGPFLAGAAVTGSLGSRLIAARLLRIRVPPEILSSVGAGFRRLSLARRLSVRARSKEMIANAGPVSDAVIAASTSVATQGVRHARAASKQSVRLLGWTNARARNMLNGKRQPPTEEPSSHSSAE